MQNKNSNNTNFWISYADLMAGLLFVFILLIGAIIVKYSLLQTESNALEKSLQKEKLALEKNRKELNEKENRIRNVLDDLANLQKKFKLTKEDLKISLLKNEKYKNEIKLKDEKYKNEIKLKDEKYKNELKLREDLISKNSKQLKELNEDFNKTKKELSLANEEKDTLLVSLTKLEDLTKQKDEQLDKLLEELLAKKSLIESFEEKNLTLNDEIKLMAEKIKKSEELHSELSKDLENTKEKIKSFTGIKVKIITLLKRNLGDKIEIDPKNGSLRLSSKVLFDEGEFQLKDESKNSLKEALYDYFQTILANDEINRYIDKIVIEGHTNSKGNYLYNLELSQKRAFSVMDFLLSLNFENQDKLQKLISASGRAFLDPIYQENGVEDSEASRRIEIKLSLKNEDAIKEIAKLLE